MKEINIMTIQESLKQGVMQMNKRLRELMQKDCSKCSGITRIGRYVAYHHDRGLYSVEYEGLGIVCLVYAKNPFEAIELVDEFRRMAGEQE